tara:strand:- start:3138 stop:3347 length:210 start_codon:yes stop_codon:yes gene_type:complete
MLKLKHPNFKHPTPLNQLSAPRFSTQTTDQFTRPEGFTAAPEGFAESIKGYAPRPIDQLTDLIDQLLAL